MKSIHNCQLMALTFNPRGIEDPTHHFAMPEALCNLHHVAGIADTFTQFGI